MATVSQTLARFVAELRRQDVPPEVAARAKHLILDAVGCALAARRCDFARVSLKAISSLGGKGDSVVIGQSERLPLRDAVLANGILAHGLDYDDTHSEGIAHLTVATFPAALAVAADQGRSGEELLLAYIAGIEAGARLASVAQGGFHKVGFHPTSVVGAFAAALAAGRLLGLDAARLAHAQGAALSVASGSLQFIEDGAWTKRFHPGWAGVGGITAAALAREGFVAPQEAYEGRFGLYRIYLQGIEVDERRAVRELGTTWELMNVAVKPFPACHFAHAFADAAIALHGKVDFRKIEKVTALVPEGIVSAVCEPAAAKKRPVSDYDAKFSLPYIIAASLARGRFSLAELEEGELNSPEILDLAARVDYRIDRDTTFPRHYPGALVVSLGGKEFEHREAVNRGSAERPLSNAEVVKKFMENANAVAIRDTILNLETLRADVLAERLAG